MVWKKESARHSLASKRIKTATLNKIGKHDKFHFIDMEFDIAKAKELIRTHDYEFTDYPVDYGVNNLIGTEDTFFALVDVDWKYVKKLPKSDCDVPGIVITGKANHGFLIDGFHRLTKCHKLGRKTFKCYVIPYKDALTISNQRGKEKLDRL